MGLFKKMKKVLSYIILVSIAILLSGCGGNSPKETILRVGHFPNISHAQALIAHGLSIQGKGWFEERLGKDVKIKWVLFNAGPSAMESLFARAVDITYVGPNPALNSYAKTMGRDVRILAGSADGGAAMVVNPKLNLKTPQDFKGKKIGTPQLGNTQDVACRAWLINNGINAKLNSNEVNVIPTPNPEQLMLFKRGNLDAVWTIEPWVSRLEMESDAKMFINQKEAITTILVTNNRTLNTKKDLVEKFVQAHKELTDWINQNPEEAKKIVIDTLGKLMGGANIAPELINNAWDRLTFTSNLNRAELEKFVDDAYKCGFLKSKINLDKIFADSVKK